MRGLREFQGVSERLPGIGNTRFQTQSTGIEVPQLTGASTFARLQVSNTCLGTLILGRLRRLGRGFAQTFPYVAVFFDEPFDGLMVSYFNCTTGKVSHSVKDHTWSARPAAIAGVRF